MQPPLQLVKKASQSSPPAGGEKIQIIFCRGVYLAENTSQAASVEFVCNGQTNYARSRLPKLSKKAEGLFRQAQSRSKERLFLFGLGYGIMQKNRRKKLW